MEEVLIPITMFAMIFGIVYIHFSTRNKERMALIEKGADASIFKRERNPLRMLKFGLLLVGVAVGIIMGYMMETSEVMRDEVAYPSMIALFGGLGFICMYFVEKRTKNGNGEK